MESDVRLACSEMFHALAIEGPDTLRLRNRRYRCDPDRLVASLHAAVYTRFYASIGNVEPSISRQDLLAALSTANRGGPQGNGSVTQQHGAYLAFGPLHEPGTRWLRLYWNVEPRGAISIMATATAALNRLRVPFRLKVLMDVSVRRRDAVVLYIPVPLWPVSAMMIADASGELDRTGYLRPETPLFTKALQPGVGLAEDPGLQTSFGMHRTGLVARAMAKSYLKGRQDEPEQWEDLREEFALEGLSLAHPYLNAGSRDPYELHSASRQAPVISSRATASSIG